MIQPIVFSHKYPHCNTKIRIVYKNKQYKEIYMDNFLCGENEKFESKLIWKGKDVCFDNWCVEEDEFCGFK